VVEEDCVPEKVTPVEPLMIYYPPPRSSSISPPSPVHSSKY
jgi:hypothetical protein